MCIHTYIPTWTLTESATNRVSNYESATKNNRVSNYERPSQQPRTSESATENDRVSNQDRPSQQLKKDLFSNQKFSIKIKAQDGFNAPFSSKIEAQVK